MKMSSLLKGAVLFISCLGIVLPPPTVLAGPSTADRSMTVRDVALGPQNTLQGKLVDSQGIAMTETPVVLSRGDRQVAVVKTDGSGQFAVIGVPGGVYTVTAEQSAGIYRLWAYRTAPPAAGQQVLLVSQDQTVRGQSVVYQWIEGNPICAYSVLAALIVTPVAVIAANQPSGS